MTAARTDPVREQHLALRVAGPFAEVEEETVALHRSFWKQR
jgi:hypothetical protein